uniref:cation channel sperm-associated protein subunit delta n=1 Tax=Jaculus jaculus TaxID=51337 RepID=UPI001E1B1738|nr:cation channel sperm-associated protein subunit delta [Jaculus jaculus]
MLIWDLVVFLTLQLWSLMGAQPACRSHTVRTGKVFNVVQTVTGDVLRFAFPFTMLIRHPCDKKLALYLGKHLFFTRNNFESSMLPFTIPQSMAVGTPEVTSAFFSGEVLLLVVNHKIYTYEYSYNVWGISSGVDRPVSHVHVDSCCLEEVQFCLEMNNDVFAYMRGEPLSQTRIYHSSNGGYNFEEFIFPGQKELTGTLGGIFHLHSLSQVGMLIIENEKGMFAYSDHPLNRSLGLVFDYKTPLEILCVPGQRGFLILWSQSSLLVSPNSGQIIDYVKLQGNTVSSWSADNITIYTITTNENELAILTREDELYYGSHGYLQTTVMKLFEQRTWLEDATMTFEGPGILNILTPVSDPQFQAFDFQKCFLNLQTLLRSPAFHIPKCNVELLQGPLEDHLYTIDMNSNLELSAFMVPQPGTFPVLLVMVSNPHSLGFQAILYEYENTLDGNIKFKLDIELKQQHHWGRSDPNFTSSLKRPTVSSLTIDIANKPLSCVDLKPLSTLISVGCDTKKKIVVQNKISACSKGLLDAVELQNNYQYIIEKKYYRPRFSNQKATSDLLVIYPYKELGCPRLVYYDTPWKPVMELWLDGELQHVVDAEYVLREVNGVFTYSYSLTAGSAGCVSQPQNWTTVGTLGERTINPWNRETYVSCHNLDENNPLRWPDVQYQILGGPTDNKLVFEQRNGIYIFFISIVDPYFSYCHLETTFSIYVYGAYPLPLLQPVVVIMGLITSTLLAVWLAYFIPKQLETEKGHHFQDFWSSVCRRTARICTCQWLWRWQRARKIQAATKGPTEDSQRQDPQIAHALVSK